MSPVSFFLFVNIVRVMDIQLHIPIISLLSQGYSVNVPKK